MLDPSAARCHELPPLERAALASPQLEGRKFTVIGHTDAKGSASYNKSLQLDPNFWMAWQDLAAAQARSGDYVGAKTSLTRALELNPNSDELKRDLAALPQPSTRPAVTSTQ